MSLNIKRFPHASYNSKTRIGWLCEYYGLYQPTSAQWRNQSYSPEILNYKVGAADSLKFFLREYIQLLEHVRIAHDADYLYVVPIPASTPEADSGYTTTPQPRAKPQRNRDNRNTVFCGLIHDGYEFGIKADLLARTKPKVAKDRLTPQEHADTMAIKKQKDMRFDDGDLIVLVDDVTTTGGTIEGAKLLLSSVYPEEQIIMLPLATNVNPLFFRSIQDGAR